MNKHQIYCEMKELDRQTFIQVEEYLQEIEKKIKAKISIEIPLAYLPQFWIGAKSQQYFEQQIPIQKSYYMEMPNLSYSETQSLIKNLQNQELFKMKVWDYRISASFTKDIFNDYIHCKKRILSTMYQIVKGQFFTTDYIQTKTVQIRNALDPGQQFFVSYGQDLCIVFEVKIHQIPQLCQDSNQILQYKYEHIITFVSFTFCFREKFVEESIREYLLYEAKEQIIDFTKIKPKQVKQQIINQNIKKQLFEIKYLQNNILKIQLNFSQSQLVKHWLPCKFHKLQVESKNQKEIQQTYQFSQTTDKLEILNLTLTSEEQVLINDILISLNNYKAFKVNDKHKQIFTQNKSMLVFGQQGSGKTTFALIKMLLQIKVLERRISQTTEQIKLDDIKVIYVAFRSTQVTVLKDTYQQYLAHTSKSFPLNGCPITPQFVTLDHFLMQIDSMLMFPFFRQTDFHQVETISEAESISGKIQVTFDLFLNQFIKKYVKSIKAFTQIHPQYLWSYLQSYAYGTRDAYKYQGLNPEIKIASHSNTIAMLAPWYQSWKLKNNYFDKMDFVNYLIQQIVEGKINKLKQYFFFIDEVQELQDAVLMLFKCLTKNPIYFAGDILQTISDSISLYDQNLDQRLQNLYSEKEEGEIYIFKLQKSHRGNEQIEKIQNLLINLQYLITPSYLDVFRYETASKAGEKQILINSQNIEVLEKCLVKAKAIFQKDIVILVRNDEAKKEVPQYFNYIKIYTIEEAKGLQFQEVILFNFFKNSQIKNWFVLQGVRCRRSTEEDSKNIHFYVEYKYSPFIGGSSAGKECWGHEFCLELRTLYIAITRSTKRVIVFDSDHSNRIQMQELWGNLYAFDFYQNGFKTPKKNFEDQLSLISEQEWEDKGRLFLQDQLYEQSMYCFQQTDLQQLYLEAKALNLLKKGLQLNKELQILQRIKQIKKLGKGEQLQDVRQNRLFCYQEAIDTLLQIGKEEKAAECYILIEQYEKAYDIYKKLGMKKQIANIAYLLGNFQEAVQYYIQIQDLKLAIKIFQKVDNFDEILIVLSQQKYDYETNLNYLKQLFPIIFKQLERQIKEKLIPKKSTTQNEEQILQIIEVDEEQSENEEEESQDSEDEPCDQSESFSVQNTNEYQNCTSNIVSFVDKNQSQISQSFQVDRNESGNYSKLEILQKYDSEDEWLQDSDNRSVMQSISGESSDFSVFSYAQIQQNPQIQIVSTQSNIFIEDQIMSKLIQYTTLFQKELQLLIKNQEYHQGSISLLDDDQLSELMFQFDFVDMEFISLMLNVLYEFKSYKLCIYVCNRYKISDNLGKYLVAISVLHSPISVQSLKVCSQIISNGKKRQSYVEQGIIGAYAVHSVLEIFNPQFMKLKFEDEEMTLKNSLGLEIYQQMIILGFWKKIVYQLDVQNALQVCEAYLDFNNWKFIYFTNLVHQLESDVNQKNEICKNLVLCKKKLQICFTPQTFFDVLYFDMPSTDSELSLAIICMEQFFIFCSYQLVLNDIVKQNSLFFQNSMDQKIFKFDLFKLNYPKFLSNTCQFLQDIFLEKRIKSDRIKQIIQGFYSSQQIYQYESCLLIHLVIIIYSKQSDIEINIEDEEFLKLVTIVKSIVLKIEKNQLINKSQLFLYKCRNLNQLMFKPIGSQILVHRTSPLMQTIIQEAQQKQSSPIYFQDVDLEFILIDAVFAYKLIQHNIQCNLKRFIYQRNHFKLEILQPNMDPNQYLKELCHIVGVGYQYEDVHYSNGEKNDLLKRYKKLEEKTEKQRELSSLMMNINIDMDQDNNKKSSFRISKEQLQIELLKFEILQQDLPIRVKNGLSDYAFYLLRKSTFLQDSNKKHKKVIFAFLILNILNLNNYSIAFAEKHNQKSYINFVEFLECCNHKFYTDAACCFFQYYDYKHKLMLPEEIKGFMLKLFTMQFIQTQLAQSNQITIKFPINQIDQNINSNYLSRQFSQCKVKFDNQIYYIQSQYPVVQDQSILVETLKFCQEQFDSDQDQYQQEIIQIVLLYLLNVEIENQEMLNYIIKIHNSFKLYYPKSGMSKMIESILLEANKTQRLNLLEKHLDILHYKIYDVIISNNLEKEQADQLYMNSINKWEQHQNQNIALKHKCQVIMDKYRSFKRSRQQKPTKYRISDLRKGILQIYYEKNISNPNQFHILYKMLTQLDQHISDSELNLIEQNIERLKSQLDSKT